MPGILKEYKTGNCTRCPKTNTPGVKRGRDFLCISCAEFESTCKYMNNLRESRKNRYGKMLTVSIDTEISNINDWYGMVAAYLAENPYCENCGAPIAEKYFRAASAHIIAKALFPSVSTHPLNFLALGSGCGCHSQWDSSIETASKMQCWSKGAGRFLQFEPYITERHRTLYLFKSLITIPENT
jgi:hypothetical protein